MINVEDLINIRGDIKIYYNKKVCLIHYTKSSDNEAWFMLHNFKGNLNGGRPVDFYNYKHDYKHSYFLMTINWLGTSLDPATPTILKESIIIHDKSLGEM